MVTCSLWFWIRNIRNILNSPPKMINSFSGTAEVPMQVVMPGIVLAFSFLSPSGDLGISLVWGNHPPHRSFMVRLLKSSSNWTKLSMRSLQLFSGWYRMVLDVFRCSQLFSDVFSWVVTFIESLPVQCITTPCAHILWSSLYEVWQDQDASVGNQIEPNSTT